VQNYGPGVWDHTWSLAVEEHFYVGLTLLLLWMVRLAPGDADPFRRIPAICVALAIACLLLRAARCGCIPTRTGDSLTRLQHDAHADRQPVFRCVSRLPVPFRAESVRHFLASSRNRLGLAILTAFMLLLCFVLPAPRWFLVFGFTSLYLGFGGLLVLCLESRDLLRGSPARAAGWLGSGCAYVGRHSYSIYLWHLPFLTFAPYALRKVLHVQLPPVAQGLFYFIGACALGILFARAIGFPVLKLRERFFPARENEIGSTVSAIERVRPEDHSQDLVTSSVAPSKEENAL
jgi:peptidoglycan/LPS O-acetylase OafA/YrhL